MKTQAMNRFGTVLQVTSLIASITTFILLAAPPPDHTAHASAMHIERDVAPEPMPEIIVEAPEFEPPIPPCEWTPKARTMLTRMVLIESATGRDAAAIAWTMARRWRGIASLRGESFADYVESTSAILRAHGLRTSRGIDDERAAVLAGLTGHQTRVVLDASPKRIEVGERLDAWARGEVDDPCDAASFMWSAPSMDLGTERVDCGDTANRFYKLPSVSHPTVRARLDEPMRDCDPNPPHTPR